MCLSLYIYVDDIIIISSVPYAIDDFLRQLRVHFVVKDLGTMNFFLGVEIFHLQSGLVLSQHRYHRSFATYEYDGGQTNFLSNVLFSCFINLWGRPCWWPIFVLKHSGLSTILVSHLSKALFVSKENIFLTKMSGLGPDDNLAESHDQSQPSPVSVLTGSWVGPSGVLIRSRASPSGVLVGSR